MNRKRVLLIDDDASFREVMRFHLEEEGYTVESAADGEEGWRTFLERPFPVVITDLKMPRMDGMTLLPKLLALAPDALVIVITAFGDIASAVSAMKVGAFEFLPKPCDRDHFKLAVRRAFEHAQLKCEVRLLKDRLGSEGKPLVYVSRAMEKLVLMADRLAASDATVLIQGESGTGKELLARRIHERSDRKSGPFIAVNCGAIPRELLESELFGHVKGAFTGARQDRKGRFLQAEKGTLFLDEVAELPPELQTKLLRALQEKVIDLVGGEKPAPVDIRVIAAMNQDAREAVRGGRLREDLYYRLNVVSLSIPPLRDRREDVLPLMKHFLDKHGEGKDWTIPPALARKLESMPWRGNVRELENLCQRIALLSDDPVIAEDLLPTETLERSGDTTSLDLSKDIVLPPEGVSLEALERAVIVRALEMNRYNQSRAARFLRIPRHVLLYRIEKFGIPVRGGTGHDKAS